MKKLWEKGQCWGLSQMLESRHGNAKGFSLTGRADFKIDVRCKEAHEA